MSSARGGPGTGARAGVRRGVGIGVLALQGDVREHLDILGSLGALAVPVRRSEELAAVDGLVLPGGESTAIAKVAADTGLLAPLRAAIAAGLPVYGSCAGMILLADRILDAAPGQETFGGLDVTVRRNAFGRQVDSFEGEVALDLPGGPMQAIFIRAPWVEQVGPGVRVLGRIAGGASDGRIVAVRQGDLVATSFHPELTGDRRVHALFVEIVTEAIRGRLAQCAGSGAAHEEEHHGRPLQVGDDQAQEGRHRRQARQAVRQAGEEHRGGGTDRRR